MIKRCRVCKSKQLASILSLGNQYLSEFGDGKKFPPKYPLNLVLCKNCSLVQLRESTPPTSLYTNNYGYRSGINNTIRSNLKETVQNAQEYIKLNPGDVVLDIGSNDATLLKYYPKNVVKIGFDPIRKFKEYYNLKNLIFVNDYFTALKYPKQKKAKIITIISCFYDLEDPNKFVQDLLRVLSDDGIIIIQQNYIASMLSQNAFDNIVHEHIEYYSLKSLEYLFNKHGLEIFKVETNSINGGSFRTHIRRIGSVGKMRLNEKEMGLENKQTYLQFSKRVKRNAKKLKAFLEKEVRQGKTIYLYGASTRGNSLLQVCRLNNKLIKAAVERNPEKWGKKISSLKIPIISEDQARKDKPSYMLVLPWFFKEEFLEREREYLKSGGHFIFPLPEFEVV